MREDYNPETVFSDSSYNYVVGQKGSGKWIAAKESVKSKFNTKTIGANYATRQEAVTALEDKRPKQKRPAFI